MKEIPNVKFDDEYLSFCYSCISQSVIYLVNMETSVSCKLFIYSLYI